ncbi:MAG TPA: hypothetical protein VLL25_20220, partial [Acidimicrobiales bacterium]|nr:hypothetical protein [Acidimicrobiales bacterium]
MTADGWPTLDKQAYYGPLGAFVLDAQEHTEADPAAILVSGLVAVGALIGRKPHAWAGDARHGVNLDAVIVGESSKARKGTSWAVNGNVLEVLDESFAATRVMSGFGSGEKLVDELAAEAGDKRLLVVETEFSRVLRVCARDGSVLSQIIRDAWDGRPLQIRSRSKTSIATEHHVAV